MRARAGRWALVIALATAATCAAPAAPAAADLAWKLCAQSSNYACAHLTVPVDRTGAVPGTLSLAIRRRRAPVGDESVAVFALAGGPGQAALPLTDGLASSLGSALSTRDLIVFDQRGTGLSGALKCAAFAHRHLGPTPPGALVAACARQLGPRNADYTTDESVQDIEAIRAATGYRKIVLYGTSYGTKVALDYARRYPGHVESLLLDSVVPADGPDVFSRSTFAAVGRVLSQLCAARRCAHITSAPTAQLAALAARLRGHPLHAPVIDGHGVAHRVAVSQHDLLDILVAGDLEPALRAEFPEAVRSALNGDGAPLARLRQRALASESGEGIDNELFYSTYCEEAAFPWDRGAPPGQRLGQLEGAAAALPRNAFAPFDTGVAVFESGAFQCYDWPFHSTAAAATGPPLPNVPTLILSGADDLRTPTADARGVAAQLPDAKLVVVPFTGHSVLGGDPGKCSGNAVQAFFAGKPIKPCRGERLAALLRPAPVPPRRLRTVRAYRGIAGRPGRTVTAVGLTLTDLSRQLVEALDNVSSLSQLDHVRVGGLRAGWAQLGLSAVRLHGVSFVPGVTVSGRLSASRDVLVIGGRSAARGVLSARAGQVFSGTLGGVHVRLRGRVPTAASAVASAARAGGAHPPRVP